MNKSLILNRIKIAYSLKNDAELARFLEIQRNTLSNWYSRNTIDYDKVFLKCELLNFDWLLTGEGEMLKNAEVALSSSPPQENDKYISSLEKINALQEKEIKRLEKEIERLKGKDIYIMEEKIENQRKEINALKSQNTGTSTAFSSSKRV